MNQRHWVRQDISQGTESDCYSLNAYHFIVISRQKTALAAYTQHGVLMPSISDEASGNKALSENGDGLSEPPGVSLRSPAMDE